jgi:urease accessory protein
VADAAFADSRAAVLRGNRAAGRIALTARVVHGKTQRTRVYEDGPLRMRFPRTPTGHLEAVIVNTAGGVAGGDRLDIGVTLAAEADLVVTTAAAEKVYRSDLDESQIAVHLTVDSGASLSWLPQETILFDRAWLSRSTEIDVSGGASLLWAESVVFGRSAMGETVQAGRLVDRLRVRRDGKLQFADTLRLEGEIAGKMAQPAIAAGAIALATVLVLPAGEGEARALRDMRTRLRGEFGVSSWNGFAVVRLCAKDGAALRHDLIALLSALSARPLPRLWLN